MLVLGEVSIPEGGVRLVQDQVVAYLNDSPIAGEGTLAVAESSVTWISRREGGRGFSLSYPSIIMHAVCTDVSSFPHEHVLVVADAGRAARAPRRPIPLYTEEEAAAAAEVQLAQQELAAGDEGGAEDDDSSDGGNLILRFVPSDLSALDTIYKEMAECQELNPEEEDMEESSGGEEEGEEGAGYMPEFSADGELGPGWYTAGNLDNVELSEEGRANLERMMRNAAGHGNGSNGHHDGDEDEEHGMEE